ncbi:MAG: pacearchaeosortase [Nanoarchaeota archaeon]|nr:pacearchaeosortase [Nanoarchaeota archaeon]
MKKRKNRLKEKYVYNPLLLLLRYLILLGLMFTLPLIYNILTPLTVYSVGFLLKLFYQISISGDIIAIFPHTIIQIIAPCVAGSAYLLLLILNLTLPMKLKTRVYSILFSTALLFILNILRIFFLAVLLVNNSQFFGFTHKLFWYVLSTVFVVGIWFLTAFLFRIREIPVYSDIKHLIADIKANKHKK